METARRADPNALYLEGLRHHESGRHAEAARALASAIELHPRWPDAMTALGNVARAMGKTGDAMALHRAALAEAPESAAIWSNLALAHKAAGDAGEAIACLARAAALAPQDAAIRFNLGNAYRAAGRGDAAMCAYEDALAREPAHMGARINKAAVLKETGRVAEAVAVLEEAVRLDPTHGEAEWNLALALLLSGRMAEGWRAYEARRRLPSFPVRRIAGPEWLGEPLDGKPLLIHAEQGLGDTIQFVRYVRFAARAGARTVLASPRSMHRLLDTCHGLDEVVTPESDNGHARQVPLLSLPRLAGDWPGATEAPYLYADPAKVRFWGERLGPRHGLRVGICWQGNPNYAGDAQRSVPLEVFAPLAGLPGVTLYSLHKGPGQAQLSGVGAALKIVDLGAELDRDGHAFVDTAAAMVHLDLVVSTDTAIPHLAGALGRPVWLLLPHVPDWRWGLVGETTPWYPTMRLFRQTAPGSWPSVFARVRAALAAFQKESSQA